MDGRPTWELIVDAAQQLTTEGRSPFKLAELIEAVQERDAGRDRTSIQPVVQGMTLNAGKGPPSPCGKILVRVERGYYALQSNADGVGNARPALTAAAPRRRARRTRSLTDADVRRRVDAVVEGFDEYLETYDQLVPFTRSGQYELHRQTIDRRTAVGSVEEAIHDDQFTDLLYRTLQAWGIGRRRSRLVPLQDFRRSLALHADAVSELGPLRLEAADLDVSATARRLDRLISELAVVDNLALIVAGTKTLHHLLPGLVPPMDRAWTGAFFGWSTLDPQHSQSEIFSEAFDAFATIAVATHPSRLVGPGWRTSPTKLVDNAVIGFCKAEGIGGTPG